MKPTMLRQWVHHRAHHGPATHAHISRQRRFALYMTIFAGIRVVAWTACMLLIIAYAIGAKGTFILFFVRLSSLVLWVSFISYYCNAATDFASFMAGVSALFSADSHATAVTASSSLAVDFAALESDIARLAELQPGPAAEALAAEMVSRCRIPAASSPAA